MEDQISREERINRELAEANGPLIGGSALRKALGFSSAEAFRQAYFRGHVPIKVFSIPNRRGKFAYTCDVATWLANLKE